MREADDDALDRAYRKAVDALAGSAEEQAAAQRRRSRVLQAVQALPAEPAPLPGRAPGASAAAEPQTAPAANEERWTPHPVWWRGAAAACVIVTSALLVVHLGEQAPAPSGPERRDRMEQAARPLPQTAAAPPMAVPDDTAASAVVAARQAPRQAPTASLRDGRMPRPQAAPAPTESNAGPSAVQAAAGSPVGVAGQAEATAAAPAPAEGVAASPAAAAPAGQAAAEPRAPTAAPAARRGAPMTADDAPAVAASPARESSPKAAAADAGVGHAFSTARARRLADSGPAGAPQALLAAVAQGDQSTVRRLLRLTHPDSERDADGRTALATAVLRSDVPMVKLLLGGGANPQARDRFGRSALDYAEAGGDASMLAAFGKP